MLEVLRRERDYIPARIAMVILCGVVIQILPTIATLQLLVNSLTNAGLVFLFPYDPMAFGAYFFITIIYSYLVSVVFSPRRKVSPVLIQAGSVSLTAIILLAAFVGINASQLQSYPTFYEIIASRLAFSLFLSLMFGAILGAIQSIFVGMLMGLSFESIDKKTFLLSSDYEKVKAIFHDRKFVPFHQLVIREETSNAIIADRRIGIQRQILVAARADMGGTILATIAFETRNQVMMVTPGASDVILDLRGHILGKLQEENPGASITERVSDDHATQIATTFAMTGTESAFSILNRLSAWQKAAGALILLFLAVTSYLFSNHQLSASQYFEGLVIVVIGGLLELTPLVAETLRERSALRRMLLQP